MRHGLDAERAHRAAADRARLSPRPAAGRHQRRAIFADARRCTRRTTRCSASPTARYVGRGRPPAPDARAPLQVGRPRCARCSPTCRRRSTTRWSIARRCAFMPEPRKPILPAFADRGRRRRGRASCAPRRATGSSAGSQRARAGRRRGARGRASPIASASNYELGVIVADGLRRLFPDRRRLHPVGEGAGHPGRARAAARAPARSSPGR